MKRWRNRVRWTWRTRRTARCTRLSRRPTSLAGARSGSLRPAPCLPTAPPTRRTSPQSTPYIKGKSRSAVVTKCWPSNCSRCNWTPEIKHIHAWSRFLVSRIFFSIEAGQQDKFPIDDDDTYPENSTILWRHSSAEWRELGQTAPERQTQNQPLHWHRLCGQKLHCKTVLKSYSTLVTRV